jgi:single-strand DNA-binding protein
MRSVNKVILIGNLTRDPEIRNTAGGQTLVTFTIATNRDWVNSKGVKCSSTEYHDIVVWSKLAEICGRYLRKSKLIYIEGYIKSRSWDTPEGLRRYKTEIVAYDMIMLDKRTDGDLAPLTPITATATAPTNNEETPSSAYTEEEAEESSNESGGGLNEKDLPF